MRRLYSFTLRNCPTTLFPVCFAATATRYASDDSRPGDWSCPSCGKLNFSKRGTCFSCSIPKPQGMPKGTFKPFGNAGASGPEPVEGITVSEPFADRKPASQLKRGDWVCSKCSAHNFAFRSNCLDCGNRRPAFDNSSSSKVRPETRARRSNTSSDNHRTTQRSTGNTEPLNSRQTCLYGDLVKPGAAPPKAGDWRCGSCQYLNFASRATCKTCGTATIDANNLVFTDNDIADLLTRRRTGRRDRDGGMDKKRTYSPSPRDVNLPGDWDCPQCGYHNFASRSHCHKCSSIKNTSDDDDITSGTTTRPSISSPANKAKVAEEDAGLESMLSEVLGST